MAYTISGKEFKSKEKIRGYVRQNIDLYKCGEPLSGEHKQFMVTLLPYRGMRYFEKVGCGIDQICIHDSPGSHGKQILAFIFAGQKAPRRIFHGEGV